MKAEPKTTLELFFNQRQIDVQTVVSKYIKEVCEHAAQLYKGYKQEFEVFIDLLSLLAEKDIQLMHKVLFKNAKFAHLISPMMLDCDNLQAS